MSVWFRDRSRRFPEAREGYVIDGGQLRVERSLEETKPNGLPRVLRFKGPKNKTSRRTLALPSSIIGELRCLRRELLEQNVNFRVRLQPKDDLIFRRLDDTDGFGPLYPNSITTEWRRLKKSLELPDVSLHAWRHTHASALIADGLDVVKVSRRLRHANPTVTLNVYAHLFQKREDEQKRRADPAAAAFDKRFGSVFSTGTGADEWGTENPDAGVNLVSGQALLHQKARSST